MKTDRPALYTTVYPGVEPFLADWYRSVRSQCDSRFDLWIGVDGLSVDAVKASASADLDATWVVADDGGSPAAIRQKAIVQIVERHPVVVFVDSDDVLEPTRIEAAVSALRHCDVVGCAMRLMDESGRGLDGEFGPSNGTAMGDLLACGNVFGLTNTAYRSETLRRCLPIPETCRLVDWFLITRAWGLGARIEFDHSFGMTYRLHGKSMAVVRRPFTRQQVAEATRQVLSHYHCVLSHAPGLPTTLGSRLRAAQQSVLAFDRVVCRNPEKMQLYINRLNELPQVHIWWSCVAHPDLETIWNGQSA